MVERRTFDISAFSTQFGISSKKHRFTQVSQKDDSTVQYGRSVIAGASDRSGTKPGDPRVLQSLFCNSQKHSREMETHIGLKCFQSFCKEGEVQNGNSRIHSADFSDRRLGNVNRFFLSLPSHSNSSSFKKVPSLRSEGNNLSVQSSADGSYDLGQDLFQGESCSARSSTQTRHTSPSVSRRLAHSSRFSKPSFVSNQLHSGSSKEVGVSNKLFKVRTDSNAEFHLSRIPVSSRVGNSFTYRGEMAEAPESSFTVSSRQESSSSPMAVSYWPFSFNREASTFRNASSQAHSEGTVRHVVSCSEPGGSVAFSRGVEGQNSLVDKETECIVGRTDIQDETSHPSVLRCFRRGLGRSHHTNLYSARVVGRRRSESPYKCFRNVECMPCDGSFSRCVQGQISDGGFRQCNSSSIYKETGRNQVQVPDVSNLDSIRIPREESHLCQLSSHSRQAECVGRPVVQTRATVTNRMDYSSQNSGLSVANLGEAHGRPFCSERQQEASNFCVSNTRPGGLGSGRVKYRLEQSSSVRLSSDGDSSDGSEESGSINLSDGSVGSSMAQTTLVSQAVGASDRSSQGDPALVQASQTNQHRHISQNSGNVQPSCLALIERSYKEKGFSQQAAERMARGQKSSTLGVYEGQWKGFCDWCSEREIDPLSPSPQVVADFLCEKNNLGRAFSTLVGYKTAINKVWKAVLNVDLNENDALSNLLANFKRDFSKRKDPVPKWDLSLVLQTLSKPPFEPLDTVDLKFVTFKTIFLLALASGRRRGELHALKADIQRTEVGSEITLFTDVQFVAKTKLADRGCTVMQPLVIRALSNQDQNTEELLCVVRSVQKYLVRTEDIRRGRERLFVSFKKGFKGDICANTISSWIKKTVLLAYESSSEDHLQQFEVRAHDVRGLAASWALLKNVSLEEILGACSWRSHNTFTQFYLKDLSSIQGELLKLSVVTALH